MLSIEHSILEYKICDDDLRLYNPYLENLKKIIDENNNLDVEELASLLLTYRNDFVTDYCFTIPYYDILKKVASYSPIVEIGAGSGYWARCLSKMGADVIAYDSFPPGNQSPWEWYKVNSWFDDSWYNIIEGDESVSAGHPDRALFMAWPVPMNPMAYNALVNYKNAGGRTLIYIGNPHPESSGDEFFYQLLYRHKEIENIDLYSWPGINEKLLIYSLA
ncbi:MAG TPA: hypothetical protein PKG60_05645 [Spirochaetota bacterium]|nr:hypothetical protein [Spirochaetota bacterium]HPS86675.1 hypothetical protein [Spirochaetota bacterium]